MALLHAKGILAAKRREMAVVGVVSSIGMVLVFAAFRGQHNQWAVAARLSLIVAIYAAALGLTIVAEGGIVLRVLRSKFLRSIGRVSYSAYIFHPFVFDFVFTKVHGSNSVQYVLCFALTFALSYASWFAFERHFLRLKDVLAPERSKFPPAVELLS